MSDNDTMKALLENKEIIDKLIYIQEGMGGAFDEIIREAHAFVEVGMAETVNDALDVMISDIKNGHLRAN